MFNVILSNEIETIHPDSYESDRVRSPNNYSPTTFLIQLNPMEYTRILTGHHQSKVSC